MSEFTRRAGVHELRAPARAGARQGEPPADRARSDGRARLPLPLGRGRSPRPTATTRSFEDPHAPTARPGHPRAAPRRRHVTASAISTLDLLGSRLLAPRGERAAPAGARRPGGCGAARDRPRGVQRRERRQPASDDSGRFEQLVRHRRGGRGADPARRLRRLARAGRRRERRGRSHGGAHADPRSLAGATRTASRSLRRATARSAALPSCRSRSGSAAPCRSGRS